MKKETIDFIEKELLKPFTEATKDELTEIIANLRKYGLKWEEQPEEVEEKLKQYYPILKNCKDIPEVYDIITNPDNIMNYIIEGDNLHSLNCLTNTHKGKISIIYIDPPYNLGNKDFIYNDKFVNKDDAYRHSKWLSFMDKRLKIAKELLTPEGVIFISINDREQAELKLMCDSIYGAENFIAMIIRKGTGGRQDSEHYAIIHEYVLCYARSSKQFVSGRAPKDGDSYPKYDEENKRHFKTQLLRKWGDKSRRVDRPNLYYPLFVDFKNNDIVVYPEDKKEGVSYTEIYPMLTDTEEGRWRWKPATMKDNIKEDKIEFINTNGKLIPYERVYKPSEDEKETKLYSTWLDDINNDTGTKLLKSMFGSKVFDYPKPVDLIKKLLKMGGSQKNDIVLDFFCGSGTTGQGVLELNQEDGGKRQFILCTNNENNICRGIAYPRMKKVIEGYKNANGEYIEGLGGNLKYLYTDYVSKAADIDTIKKELSDKCFDLLLMKENIYTEVLKNNDYKIYCDSKKVVAIYNKRIDYSLLDEIKDKLLTMPQMEKILYVRTNTIMADRKLSELKDCDIDIKAIPSDIISI